MIGCGLLSAEDGQQMKDFLMGTVWPKTKEIGSEILNNPQVQGSLHMAGGIGEVIIGESLILVGAPTILGSAVGGVVMLHGVDQIAKGFMEFLTNKPHESITVVALQESGISPNAAEMADDFIGMAGGVAGIKILLKSGSVAEGALEKAIKEIGKNRQEIPTIVKKEFYPKVGVADQCNAKHYMDAEDWGNIKQKFLRNDVPKSELQSGIGYNKLKNELLEESHIGHGNLKLLTENGLSIKDVEKFGGKIISHLIEDGSLRDIFGKWSIGKEGTNQLLDHTIGKKYDRILEIAERAGIRSKELTDIFSTNPTNKIQALKRFDELTDQIIKEAPMRNLDLKAGKQEAYYLPYINKPDEGVIVLKYEGKKNTLMPAGQDYYERLLKNL